jgi:hypothetical protein
VTVLVAGAAGVASWFVLPPWDFVSYLGAGLYVIAMVVAIAVLVMRKHQIRAIGLLLGLWWLSAPWVVQDIAIATADRAAWGLTGSYLTSFYFGVASDVLGLIGAILLWSCCKSYGGRQARSQLSGLSKVILWSVALSQVAALVLWADSSPHYAAYQAIGISALIVGPAVAWYALRLRDTKLGGTMLLGWIASTAVGLAIYLTYWSSNTRNSNFSGITESILLGIAAITIVSYLRQPVEPEFNGQVAPLSRRTP